MLETKYVNGVELSIVHELMTILGTTKPSLWPFFESTGILVSGMALGDLIPSETAGAAEALEDDFVPLRSPAGFHTYHFNPTGDHHLAGIDDDSFSFGDGTNDSAFSVGALIVPNAINTNVIISKYDSAGNLEEYRFFIDSNGKLSLELHDASASATEIAVSDNALSKNQPIFVVAAYDGDEATPEVNLYINGVLSNDGATTESGSYVAMENTATPILIGAGGVTALPTTEFHGRIGLPFITGKQLTQNEVNKLFWLYKEIFGLAGA